MKKTAIAVALMLAAGGANAAAVSSLNITSGDFGMNAAPVAGDGMNDWAGTLAMDTSGTLITNAFNFNGIFGPVDLVANGAGLSGNDDSGSLALDMSNFAIIWNGSNIGQGPTANFMISDDGMGGFSASWESTIVGSPGGAFDGQIGFWAISGTYETAVAAVPVPAAVWLFGSGLVGLAGVARRRKAA